ncbi:MAG: ATP-binding protein [Planctomycetota bacterium]
MDSKYIAWPFFHILFVCFACPFASASNSDNLQLPRKVSAEEFRRLTPGSGELVSSTATVCYQDPLWKFLFLTDQGHGVFADPVQGSYKAGDRLQITGRVGNGHGVPIFRANASITKVGHSDLPAPETVDLSDWDWDKGFTDARNTGWVELEGSVEQITLIDNSTRLWCRAKNGLFAVSIAEAMTPREAWELYGSRIRIRGALGILLNRQNRVHGPLLLTQNRSMLEIIESTTQSTFPELASQRISYSQADEHGSFCGVGQVTLTSEGSMFVDDGFAAREIEIVSCFETPTDSFVEMFGSTDSQGSWRAHVIRLRKRTLEIWPMKLKIGELSESHLGRRIWIRAIVESYAPNDFQLNLSEEGALAQLLLPQQAGSDVRHLRRPTLDSPSLDLTTAEEIDVYGVLKNFDNGNPVIVAVSQDDIRVLSRRWVLTPYNLLSLLGILGVFLIAIGAAVLLLRRQVAARTQALSDLAAQLRASYDSVEAGVVAVSEDGTLLTVNERANTILGAKLCPGDSAAEFVQCWAEKAEDPANIFEMASAFRSEQEEPSSCEVSLTGGNGKLRLTLAPINRQGRHIGNLWVMHDETQLQTLQAELFQAQKMEAIGTLAGGIAHDFNNLLTAIIGNLQLMSMTEPEDEEIQSYIEQAEAASMSAGELVQQLLGLSRKTNTRRRVVDPNSIVSNIQALLSHGLDSSIRLRFDNASDLPSIHVDPTQIEQVLLNLCVNARDAMPEGGRILISTDHATLHGARAIVIKVSDCGEGIPTEIQDKIFEPFFTTKEVGSGTGLGLATSFSVISRHHGDLRFDSTPGEGTTFLIVLPAASAEDLCREKLKPQLESLKGQETILVVDDEWVVRTVASNLLHSGGYRTLEAKDGEEGLEVLASEHPQIDLVLLDVTMPRMSGHETLRRIRELYPTLPVLMCSGYDLTSNVDTSFENFVPKPFSASSLFDAIRRTLDQRSLSTVG